MGNIAFRVETLLAYAIDHELIEEADCYYCRNRLLDILQLEEPYGTFGDKGLPCAEAFEAARTLTYGDVISPAPILDGILTYAAEKGIIAENLTTYRDLLDARLMGELTPRPSEFLKIFDEKAKHSLKDATDYFYHLSQANHYIMGERIAKNLYWRTKTEYGDMEITINLSKPEKDPKEVARLATVKSVAYPKCLLCPENTGYAGRLNHPARENIRLLPVKLSGEDWYMQYSPYVYYNEHCIVLEGKHVPMEISEKTWRRLFDFIDIFPHYFLGSNADIPLVGGSILFHEHCQGGRHVFPMELAERLEEYRLKAYPSVCIAHLKWPLTAYRLSGTDREEICKAADRILATWKEFSAPELGIVAYTEEEGKRVRHNTITPIARKNSRGEYELDLVLRNNITTPDRPEGLFHPAPKYYHIKKENIGLIEVMGLAILPGRLRKELSLMEEILTGRRALKDMTEEEKTSLAKHGEWIDRLVKEHGTDMKEEAAHTLVQDEVGIIFSKVLECCGVFKQDEAGSKASEEFLRRCDQ